MGSPHLSVLHTVPIVDVCQPQPPNSSCPATPHAPLACTRLCPMPVSISALQTRSSAPLPYIPRPRVNVRYLFPSWLTALCAAVSRSTAASGPVSLLAATECYSICMCVPHLHPLPRRQTLVLPPCSACCSNGHWGVHTYPELGFPLGVCPGVGLLGHTVALVLVF